MLGGVHLRRLGGSRSEGMPDLESTSWLEIGGEGTMTTRRLLATVFLLLAWGMAKTWHYKVNTWGQGREKVD